MSGGSMMHWEALQVFANIRLTGKAPQNNNAHPKFRDSEDPQNSFKSKNTKSGKWVLKKPNPFSTLVG